jgi:diguanylate cyclase (GGDEF)-like protein/PAS domain S-box-containing protein
MVELQSPEILRSVLENLQTGVCVVDPSGRIVLWNRGAAHAAGYMSHEVIGRNCQDVLLAHCTGPTAREDSPACLFARILREGKPTEVRMQLRHRRGHSVPVLMHMAPIRDSQGSILAIVGSFDVQFSARQREHAPSGLVPLSGLDVATGVANHGFTQFHLRENLASFAEYHIPFGVLCVQPEGLGQFRATWGREAGDAALLVIAQTLSNSLRPSDFVGRWADDRFLVILTGCGKTGIQSVCQRIRKTIASAEIRWWGELLSLACSVAGAWVESGDSIDSLVQRAEHALRPISAAHSDPETTANG